MKETTATKSARYLLGVVLLFFGLNAYFQWMTPPPGPEAAMAFFQALMATGYMLHVNTVVMLVVGLLLLANKWVPFALTLLAPLSVHIILFHIFLDPASILFGAIVALLNAYLGYVHWDAFKPLFD